MKNIGKICLLILITAFYACNDPYESSTYQIYKVNPVSTYLETRPDDFSEWVKILKYADLFNAVNQAAESFTVFVPDNNSVQAFYKKKGVTSIQELGREYARSLAQYHIIADTIGLDRFVTGGKLESRTLSDDYLTVTFDENSVDGGGFNSMYINKEARVKETAIPVSNGYVYVLSGVLTPLVETLYERINEAGKYTIFKKTLEMTTWSDSLSIVYDEIKRPNEAVIKQKRDYTVIAVSDEAFKKDGINSVEDLIAKLEITDKDYKSKENDLFLYAAYHIIKGSHSLTEMKSFDGAAKKKLWNTLADAVMEISLESDNNYYINYGSDEVKAKLLEDFSDIRAKNGMLHEVDAYLPVWQSETPTTVYFDLCDYAELGAYIKAKGTSGQEYQTGHATSEYRTDVTKVSCYDVEIGPSGPASLSSYNYVDYFTVKTTSNWTKCRNKDQLILNIGYMGTIAMKTPVLIAGKYKVTLGMCYATSMNFMRGQTEGSNGGQMQFSFDGEQKNTVSPYPNVPANVLDLYETVIYDELEFKKTSSHTFKIVVTDPAASTHDKFRIQLDYLLFEPIIEE